MKSSTEIITEYPELYGIPPFDPMKSLLCFGFECGKGWYPLLEELSKELSIEVKKSNLKEFRVTQVKEKFGTLRFYADNGNDKTRDLINDAESKSAKTCMTCGAEAAVRYNTGYVTCICDSCEKKKQEEREAKYGRNKDSYPILQEDFSNYKVKK